MQKDFVARQDTLETLKEARGPADVPVLGTPFGRFLTLEVLGVGGMGVVVAAYDPKLDRRVALKLLRPDLRELGDAEKARQRLLHEAQAMAQLAHPNVVTVYEAGTVEERVYIAMELVEGETMRSWLTGARRSWRQIVEAFSAAGRGLAAAHAAGMVHRDFKPDNVLVGRDGRVRVSDFGLASLSSRPLESGDPTLRAPIQGSELLRGLTVYGAIMGTPAYMAPEQHDGMTVEAAADQFSFCVSLFEALYGERPFQASNYVELVAQVKEGRVREPARARGHPRVPAWLREVVVRGLARDPEQRHADMQALLNALAHEPGARRRQLLVGVAAAVLLAGVAGLASVRGGGARTDPCTGARERLAGVWDEPLRTRVRQAFLATGLPYAEATFQRASRRLRSYANRWASMRLEACRATRVHGEQSQQLLELRLGCLERRRGELAALGEGLLTVDSTSLPNVLQAASDLPGLEACADRRGLLAQVPAPEDPARRSRVAELDAQLDRIQAQLRLGKPRPSLAEARALVTAAAAAGHAPLRARAQFVRGDVHVLHRELKAAARDHLEASRLLAEARDDRALPRVLGRLAAVYQLGGNHQQALAMAWAAELAARRAQDEPNQVWAQLIAGRALYDLGRFEEAQPLLDQVLGTLDRQPPLEDRIRLVDPLVQIGSAACQRGRYPQGRELLERALAIVLETHGPEHPAHGEILARLRAAEQVRPRAEEPPPGRGDAAGGHRQRSEGQHAVR